MKNIITYITITVALLVLASCNKIAYLPEVTHTLTVTANSATISFEVTPNDNTLNPQIEYCRDMNFGSTLIVNANATGNHYEAILDSLEMNTTYYYRFIVSNCAGGYIIVDSRDCFTTSNILVTVTTKDIQEVTWDGTYCTAIGGGIVSEIGEAEITETGVCWGKNNNPSIEDDHVSCESGAGSFTVTLSHLEASSVYYARAYAISSLGTVYGNEVSFSTLNKWTDGILPGLFSVSATQKVYFSQGNLQYIGSAATPYWKFAEKQWEFLGTNGPDSGSQTVDRDLFSWGTSGYNHGAIAYQPWNLSTSNSDYYAYGDYNYNLYDQTGQADWGYNAISNGGNRENDGWRTLSIEEWQYVLGTRHTLSGHHFAWGSVDGINGMILLPDNWNTDVFPLTYPNGSSYPHYNNNTITALQWSDLERNGAVFLPSAGQRYTIIQDTNINGCYWSSSQKTKNNAAYMYFKSIGSGVGSETRKKGFSVRLVRNN